MKYLAGGILVGAILMAILFALSWTGCNSTPAPNIIANWPTDGGGEPEDGGLPMDGGVNAQDGGPTADGGATEDGGTLPVDGGFNGGPIRIELRWITSNPVFNKDDLDLHVVYSPHGPHAYQTCQDSFTQGWNDPNPDCAWTSSPSVPKPEYVTGSGVTENGDLYNFESLVLHESDLTLGYRIGVHLFCANSNTSEHASFDITITCQGETKTHTIRYTQEPLLGWTAGDVFVLELGLPEFSPCFKFQRPSLERIPSTCD